MMSPASKTDSTNGSNGFGSRILKTLKDTMLGRFFKRNFGGYSSLADSKDDSKGNGLEPYGQSGGSLNDDIEGGRGAPPPSSQGIL